ncbi:pentapeptide repeat-containing protein [Laspinema sp. A4]|uniref:pentapeptide repeat-containing protein n=1 Tax=Laspinema sp. D2d TaxID=2953686 RepID=UPI0021BB9B0A|nr:pentapeptide repeat-containing protein [Laspinema sp. D2d]MCT7983484.1 pentapeptide repeat-containing protein [Laspinema sp. D2d]
MTGKSKDPKRTGPKAQSTKKSKPPTQGKIHPVPLFPRRLAASTVELALIAVSALVPLSLGWHATRYLNVQPVPLNPVLMTLERAIAQTLALPPTCNHPRKQSCTRLVPPLVNFLWTIGPIAALTVSIWQLYLLGLTGQTLPKRWLRLQVVTDSGKAPGFGRALLREAVGRWGVTLTSAYLIWLITGAVPDLVILGVTTALMVAWDGLWSYFDPKSRTLHDRLAGTWVRSSRHSVSGPSRKMNSSNSKPAGIQLEAGGPLERIPESKPLFDQGWNRIRLHSSAKKALALGVGLAAILGTFVTTQLYIQSQENARTQAARDQEKFLTWVQQFAPDERQGAILGLASFENPEAQYQILADMLALETDAAQLDVLQQALVSSGERSLPYLQKLNQSTRTDLDSLRYSTNEEQLEVVQLRLQATQRAIAKLLHLYSTEFDTLDLSRTHLGQVTTEAAPFTLVLEKTDLSGIRFRGTILSHASFKSSQFSSPGPDRRFGSVDDQKADLTASILTDADLTGAFLSHVILAYSNLSRAKLDRANLSHAQLTGANLSSAQAIGADLREADLTNATLVGAQLGEANLSGILAIGARFPRVVATGATLAKANLTRSDWQGADLSRGNFTQSNLQNANLSETRLAGANLSFAQLQNANFHHTDLTSVNFQGANVEGADFQGAVFFKPHSQSGDRLLQSTDPATSGFLRGVDFSNARNLDNKQIVYICAQGGIYPLCSQP